MRIQLIQSHENNPVFIEIPDNLSDYAYYWVKSPNPKGLYNLLGAQIINQPYADKAQYTLTVEKGPHKGFKVHHHNHDVSHAVRKVVGIRKVLSLIEQDGFKAYQRSSNQLDSQERACLELASFCQRAGRTNELGGMEDPSNAQRSRQIFEIIATQLGFSSRLIQSISHAMTNFEQRQFDIHGFTGTRFQEKMNKARMVTSALTLNHCMDLVRIWKVRGKVNLALKPMLNTLFPAHKVENLANSLVEYSLKVGEATGTVVYDIDGQAKNKQDVILKAKVAQDPEHYIASLDNTLSPSILKPKPPTKPKPIHIHHYYLNSTPHRARSTGHSVTKPAQDQQDHTPSPSKDFWGGPTHRQRARNRPRRQRYFQADFNPQRNRTHRRRRARHY